MAGKVHHRKGDQILAEFLHWVMDSEGLTTEEEREQHDDAEIFDREEEPDAVPS
jgi:hypothetical protein